MDEIKIKNYDVLIVRILQIILPFVSSYAVIFLIILFDGGRVIDPASFFNAMLLFNGKPIALIVTWGVIASVAFFIIKDASSSKTKDSFIMKKWFTFKTWLLTLGRDFDN